MTTTDKKKDENSMKTIYKAAQVIRKSIATFTKERHVLQVSSDITDVPAELYTMIHWIMVGPAEKLETEKRTRVVDRATLTVSQNIMYGFKSSAQVKYKPSSESASFWSPHARENPQVLGLALTIHHDTRNKKLMNLLNAHGYSVSHGRALLMETALANAVVENTRGLYVPPFLRKGTFVFFAADNTDFAEDTRDGKGTTHGTITAVYQKIDPSKEPVAEPLIIGDAQSLSVTPYHVDILHCDKPTPQHAKRSEQFAISRGISESYQLTHLGWVVASALSRMKAGETYINNTVDLKETKDLFARLMVLARSNRDINQKEAIGNYEFTLTPRALFASNGKILPCHDKSKLISLLEKLTREDVPHEDHQLPQTGSTTHQDAMDTGFIDTTSTDQPSRKIALVDGMVLVQRLSKKPATVVTVKDLSGCFNDRLMSLIRDYDEIILVFDTYRTDSLKSATRDKRRQGKAIQYQVRDDTNIKHIPLSRFLSHDQTKADLTDYLAAKILEYNRGSSKLIITSASGNTRSNKDLLFEENNHEEADTLLIHQAVLASH
ncbi:hypothetical protein CgunFtcFv8_023060 [Champsocephalus gunnari]|uniref:Uncharacterized protein n=1 Tax=Champsocephalus gunnari TaxID=52237 RepID=A0AAN8D9F6_CHAGU|nr:hypothetical protein CgunFtcFv8_023060 [Champsocephalus gunnari]